MWSQRMSAHITWLTLLTPREEVKVARETAREEEEANACKHKLLSAFCSLSLAGKGSVTVTNLGHLSIRLISTERVMRTSVISLSCCCQKPVTTVASCRPGSHFAAGDVAVGPSSRASFLPFFL